MTNPQSLYSESTERAVLAALLADGRRVADVRDLVQPTDLFTRRHYMILDALYTLQERGGVVDMITLGQELKRRQQLEDIGGSMYLSELLSSAVNVSGVEEHARLVADYARRRRFGEMAQKVIADVGNLKITTDDLLNRIEASVRDIMLKAPEEEPLDMVKGVGAYFDRIEATLGLPEGVAGLATGFKDYDEVMDGLRGLSILAARPGMGKSAFAANVALNVAQRVPVYFISMEMNADEIYARFFAITDDLSTYKQRRGLRPGGLSQDEWARFVKASGKLAQYPIFIDAIDTCKPSWIQRRIERMRNRGKMPGLVIVDYLQLMEHDGKANTRENEVSRIARGLKRVSQSTGLPIMALSQLNRGLENRQNKRPNLADLRESGEIEQAGDTVTFLYRDVEYNPDTLNPNDCELIIEKNRHGAKGTVHLYFDLARTMFKNAIVTPVNLQVITHANGKEVRHDVKRTTGSLLKVSTGAFEDADAG